MFKRIVNLTLLIAGIAFVAHFIDAAMARTDSMSQSVINIASQGNSR